MLPYIVFANQILYDIVAGREFHFKWDTLRHSASGQNDIRAGISRRSPTSYTESGNARR